jgi:hypothetical protein
MLRFTEDKNREIEFRFEKYGKLDWFRLARTGGLGETRDTLIVGASDGA